MDKALILRKLDKFCPSWLERPDSSLSIEEIMQQMINQVLPGLIEAKVEQLDDNKIIGSAPFKNATANVLGYMHGGTIFTLGDTLAGSYIWSTTDENTFAVTTGSEIKYLKPVKAGLIRCTVVERSRQGRKVILEATFEDENEQPVSVMTLNYLLMKG